MKKQILIIYFSYSSQTRNIIQAFASGLEKSEVNICWHQIKTVKKLNFPLGSVVSTLKMMVLTFFRKRYEIEPLEPAEMVDFDLVILAGPTWSYNPSGPVLRYYDKYAGVFAKRKVLPIISCRGYWRIHYYQLRYMLKRKKAEVLKPLVFLHSGAEPWRTIGVFLKLAGKVPESDKSWISRYYRRFGHSREQIKYAHGLGTAMGERLCQGKGLEGIVTGVIEAPD